MSTNDTGTRTVATTCRPAETRGFFQGGGTQDIRQRETLARAFESRRRYGIHPRVESAVNGPRSSSRGIIHCTDTVIARNRSVLFERGGKKITYNRGVLPGRVFDNGERFVEVVEVHFTLRLELVEEIEETERKDSARAIPSCWKPAGAKELTAAMGRRVGA
jgi:hypothetical protein